MSYDPSNPNEIDLLVISESFSGPNTRRISDYLAGHQLGPRNPQRLLQADGKARLLEESESIAYWTGDLLPTTHQGYPAQVKAIRRSFTFRNILREGLELLADGIGADEPDWAFTVKRPLADGEQITGDEQALIDELEATVTAWWDARDIPSLIQRAVINALAHGNQPLRPRIPARYLDRHGRLSKRAPEESLDPLWLVMPEVGDAGIWQDPETMERHSIVRVWLQDQGKVGSEWETSSLDEKGNTVMRVISASGQPRVSEPLPLGGQLLLLDLRMPRAFATPDAMSQQDSYNVASTALNRNTRHAAFDKTIFIGLDPPLDESGNPKPIAGAGAEAWLSPSEIVQVEETGQQHPDGTPVTITRNSLYPGASVEQIKAQSPEAIQAAIDQAERALYGILCQQFMLMSSDATASGRSREVSTGPYLRTVARCATAVEAFIRELLMLAARISAITQGQAGKYDGLRPTVSCRQKVFEPSPDTVRVWLELLERGVVSMQTVRTVAGIADPDAERQLIEAEAAAPEVEVTEE